jgi:hypothetical protein
MANAAALTNGTAYDVLVKGEYIGTVTAPAQATYAQVLALVMQAAAEATGEAQAEGAVHFYRA